MKQTTMAQFYDEQFKYIENIIQNAVRLAMFPGTQQRQHIAKAITSMGDRTNGRQFRETATQTDPETSANTYNLHGNNSEQQEQAERARRRTTSTQVDTERERQTHEISSRLSQGPTERERTWKETPSTSGNESETPRICTRCFGRWRQFVMAQEMVPDCTFISGHKRKKCEYCSERRSECDPVSLNAKMNISKDED